MRAIIAAILMTAGAVFGGQDDLNMHRLVGPEGRIKRAIATNQTASVTDAQLLAEWQAAGNKAQQDAVLLKMFQRNAAVAAVQASEKKKAKESIGKENKK